MDLQVGTNYGAGGVRDGLETTLFSRSKRTGAIVLAALLALLAPQIALAQSDDELLITGEGVGNAVLGATAEELASALGDSYAVGDEVRITVDLNGRVVSRAGDVQFRVAMTDDSDRLSLFIVSNPAYATAEGVGPTTTIADAEAIYGDATLERVEGSREFVTFENGPDERIAFRTPGIGGTTIGVYVGDAVETTEYAEGGAIAAIWVRCEADTNCPGDGAAAEEPTAEPTATPEPEPTATPEPEAEPTATPEPEPTATPEPEAEPTAAPEPEPTATAETDAGGDDGGSTDDDTLPRTGFNELLMLAVASVLVLFGGMMVVVERHAHPLRRNRT